MAGRSNSSARAACWRKFSPDRSASDTLTVAAVVQSRPPPHLVWAQRAFPMRVNLTAFCLFGLVATLVAAGPNVPEAERISGLISQLGSSNYRERLDAFRALDAIGEAALERLKTAA